jgi:hypothetical protein
MPAYTNFLKLTLPALSEFNDSWNEPMNQNFEDLDDWTQDLYKGLSTTGASSLWATLRGNKASLVERLAVSIDDDGNINVSTSQPFLDMQTSAYYTDPASPFTTPRDRLNDGDRQTYEAGLPFANGRFVPTGESGPTAGQAFPHAELDAGIALRSADFGAETNGPISSPQRPWAPGLILGGEATFITGIGIGQIQLNAASLPAIFNIDGYAFRLRETLILDYNLIAPGNNEFVWIYVERAEAGYADTNFRFKTPGPDPAVAQDLRKMKTGSGTTTLPSTYVVAGGLDTLPFQVKEGDTLRILTGGDKGDYVIDALDGGTPDTKLTIKGIFKVGGLTANYEIIDNAMPVIGAVVPLVNPLQEYGVPPYVAGRVYIGRVKHNTGGAPGAPDITTFAKGGVYDSGWLVGTTTDFAHELGTIPSRVEIWVRVDETTPAHKPLVQRQIQTSGGPLVEGTPNTTTYNLSDVLLPSLWHYADERDIKVGLKNGTTESPEALFTDFTGAATDILAANGEIRVVAWR